MRVLVSGPSGAGKTFLTKKFREKGQNAFDSDQIDGLSSWYDFEGKKVTEPEEIKKNFLETHQFLWDREFLTTFLADKPNIYVFGMSGNAFEMLDVFDIVYFLQVPPEILRERVQHESRENKMGKTEEQREAVVSWAKHIEEKAKKLGVLFIDGTLSAEEIFKKIT